ncbi:MAG: lipocalin-like domain-containing protein [Anaerolineae bacterium]|jgi:predicted secreted hydrolase
MTRLTRIIIALLLFGLVSLGLWAGWRATLRRDARMVRSQVIAPPAEAAGFTRAESPRPFNFPADHGPHPDFQTEWWYYTGNLKTNDGRQFGYQLTFFRRALTPPTKREKRESGWATDQIYMGHFALTDVAEREHQAFERFSRGAAGLAGADSPPFRVWLEDWYVEQEGDNAEVTAMQAAQGAIAIDLRLIDRKGPILQGDRGYSQKGPDPGNASYYYSQTRLQTSGTVQVGEATFQVEGWSWMDHEFSTSALAPEQVGWDWFALQFDDGSELMVFQLRRSDGSIDPLSGGTLVDAAGEARRLVLEDFAIAPEGTWRSPRSGATYPASWTVRVPDADLTLAIQPYLADQELNVSYAYWEGAVRIEGERSGDLVTGDGYVELTGYAGSMQEQF